MPKLSTSDGNPIAKIVRNKKYKMLYLKTGEESCNSDSDEFDDYDLDEYDIFSEDELMREHAKKNSKPKCRNNKKNYMTEDKKREALSCKYKEFHIHQGMLEPVPNLNLDRDMLMLSGCSGAGKSHYAAMYLRNYKKVYPKNKIYIFSKLESDEAFNGINHKYIPITLENFVVNPIQIEELANSCCVFDDIDVITDKVLRVAVQTLRDQALEVGRHFSISVVATSHQLMNYKLTRSLINESQSVTFFPRSGSSYHIKTFLKTYGGLDKKQIDRIMNLPSRWVTIHKSYPMYILYQQGCYLL